MKLGPNEGKTWDVTWVDCGARFYLTWLFPVSGGDGLTLNKSVVATKTTSLSVQLQFAK